MKKLCIQMFDNAKQHPSDKTPYNLNKTRIRKQKNNEKRNRLKKNKRD